MGGLRKKLPWTHARVRRLLARDLRRRPFSGFFSKDSIIAGALSPPRTSAGLGLGRRGRRLRAQRRGAAGPRSTCRGSTSWSSRARPAPPTRSSTTSTSRRAAWSARWWCWRSARRWAASSASPAASFDHPDWNLFDRELSPVLGAELEIPHLTEITVMVGAARAGAGRDRPRLAVLRRRLPRAVPQVRRHRSRWSSWCEDKFRIDELYRSCIVRPIKRLAQAI